MFPFLFDTLMNYRLEKQLIFGWHKLCLTKYCMKICEQNISAIIILTCFSSMQFVLCTLLSDITTNMCNAKRNINYTASKIGISKSFTEKPRKRGYKHGKLIFLVLRVYKGLWQY